MKRYFWGAILAYALFATAFNLFYFFHVKEGSLGGILGNQEKPEDRILHKPIYMDYVEEYEMLNQYLENEKIVLFAGDSITKRFNLQEYFPKKRLVNRGIFKDTTLGFLNRINKNINNLKIEKLFLMLGYNDLRHRTNAEIRENMEKILSLVKAEKIYVQSILPTGKKSKGYNQRIIRLNLMLRDLCETKGCAYIDLHSYFVNEQGVLIPEYSRDGIHPNGKGYMLWSRLILGKI